jgi:hypothetical protein
MDRRHPCRNPALKYIAVPQPRLARHAPNYPCTVVENDGRLKVCAFGVPSANASSTIALLGDSHAGNWRAAVEVVAQAKRWHALSLALGGCPYATPTRVLAEPLRSACDEHNKEVPGWFARHPEVHTVFVAQISGVPWVVAPGQDEFEAEVNDYIAAWKDLPPSVSRIIVIRDTPKAPVGTPGCIERATARHRRPGQACRMPRAQVLDRDPAVEAAVRLHSPRVQVVDLTRYFCSSRWCYPVIGGALVQKDWNHISSVFMSTVGPYLLRQVDALASGSP